MAGAEVTMSPGHVAVVKEEEKGEPSDNHRTQVILHLEPILHGMSLESHPKGCVHSLGMEAEFCSEDDIDEKRVNESIADTGTTVLAIETHHDDNQAEGEEIEYGYPITCGDSRAVLLFKKFVCPGINVRCVKFNDQLISPKQFVHLSGKATLKDWKRAIRLGGVMLRKMMDSGQIDFYQHDTVCTNTCRSTKFDVLINSTRLPVGSSVQSTPPSLACDPLSGQLATLPGEVGHAVTELEVPPEEKFSVTADWSPGPAPPTNPTTANGHVKKRKRADMPDGILSLWKGVADIGLMGEVLSSIRTELLATLKGVEVRSDKDNLQEADAIMLNSLCEMFGLLDSVKQALDLRRCQAEETKVHSTLYVLERLEEQMKQGVDEGSPCKPTSSKCSRLHRQSPSNSQNQQQRQTSQNIVSPFTTTPVIQPLTVTSLPVVPLAHLPIGAQHFAHYPVSVSAGQWHKAGIVHGVAGMERDGHSSTLEREHEARGIGGQERFHRLGEETVEKEDTPDIRNDPALETVGAREEDSHPRENEVEKEKERLHDIEQVVVGRKASKKHKTK